MATFAFTVNGLDICNVVKTKKNIDDNTEKVINTFILDTIIADDMTVDEKKATLELVAKLIEFQISAAKIPAPNAAAIRSKITDKITKVFNFVKA